MQDMTLTVNHLILLLDIYRGTQGLNQDLHSNFDDALKGLQSIGLIVVSDDLYEVSPKGQALIEKIKGPWDFAQTWEVSHG